MSAALEAWCRTQCAAFDELPEPVRRAIAEDPNQLAPDYFREMMLDLRRRHPRRREKWLAARLLEEVAVVSRWAHLHHERVMAEALER